MGAWLNGTLLKQSVIERFVRNEEVSGSKANILSEMDGYK